MIHVQPYTNSETPVFKSSKSAPFCNELKEFEKDLFDMISNVNFDRFMPKFQQNLKKDLKAYLKR